MLREDIPIDVLIARLQDCIPRLMEQESVIGLSLALIADAQVVWQWGVGFTDKVSRRPVTTDTVFEAASLSKPLFAYAILKLCATGRLTLDEPLATYLPQPYVPDEPSLAAVTARHVLSHTSGLPNWRWPGQALRIYFRPGQRFSYSGEGYVYLQHVLAQVTGQSPASYLRTNLLEPLDMVTSSYTWLEQYETQAAQGHDDQGERTGKWKPQETNAAASLHTTPAEFALFMTAMMRPRPNVAYLLSTDLVEEMLKPQVPINDDAASWIPEWPQEEITENEHVSWGLGWGIQHEADGDTFWHWGANQGFRAFAVGSMAAKTGLVIMSNSQRCERIWRTILQESTRDTYPSLDWVETLP